MKLSILIPTVPSRIQKLTRLLTDLHEQEKAFPGEIEILAVYDNKTRILGQKRNDLVQLAQGEFLTFIDDDDRLSPDYLVEIMKALRENPDTDCVVYEVDCSVRGAAPYRCYYGVEYDYTGVTPAGWFGKPAHTMVWRSSIAKAHAFPIANFGEDTGWVKLAWPDIKKQTRIGKVLYFYDADDRLSETVGR